MKVNFLWPMGAGKSTNVEFDTAARMLRYNGVAIPYACSSADMQRAAMKAKVDALRKINNQSGHALLMEN